MGLNFHQKILKGMQNFVVKAHIFPLKNVKSILKDKVPSNNSSSISWKSFDFFLFLLILTDSHVILASQALRIK